MMYIKVVPDAEPNADGEEIMLQEDNIDVVRARFMSWSGMCKALESYVPHGHHIVKFGRRE
jgi:hypothetical protein